MPAMQTAPKKRTRARRFALVVLPLHKIVSLLVVAVAMGCIGVYFLQPSKAATNPNLKGDLNNDSIVNLADLSILLSNYNKPSTDNDLDGDGNVGLSDLSILLSNYGKSVTTTPPTPPPSTSAKYPADVLDLKNWYITLPIAGSSATSPKTINQPELATYTIDPWFHLNADKTGIVFHVNHGGVSTSNSANPRSELREMTNNGKDMASWSSTTGTSTMTIKQKVTHLTTVKPQVVVGQIHDANDDVTVFRLEGSSLWITDGDTTHAHLLTDSYQLGTVFTVKFEVSGGVIKYYYNGQLVPYTQKKNFTGAYFKAGNYLQSNPSTAPSESTSAYAEVEIFDVQVTHN
jgi:hypothetical protein